MGYFKSLDSIKDMESTPIGVSFSSLSYTHSSFLDNINNGTFSNTKIKSIIENNVDTYFNYDMFNDPKTRTDFQHIWTNLKFLDVVATILGNNEYIRHKVAKTYIRDVNTIAYDYIVNGNDSDKKDEETIKISEKLLDIAGYVNAEYVVKLSAVIPVSWAKNLSVTNFSNFDRKICIKRLCNGMDCLNSDKDVAYGISEINENQIIHILYVFHSTHFSNFFSIFMTADIEKPRGVDHKILKAIFAILESMPTSEIMKVLEQYSSSLTLSNIISVKTSLKKLPQEYGRISRCVKEVEQNGYYIP